jgi:Na+-transporting methylmalonyl-CoA/oxaloacetate decarboxylase gamma subunit
LSTTRLKGHVGIVVAGVVLAVLAALSILAVLPGMAEAQEEAEAQEDMGPPASVEAEQNSTTDDEKGASATTRFVVEPGDSLWSISEEHIGPGATPEQIAYEVERIFELNRDQIGENPNLIFPGQEFFLVSAAPGGAAAAPEQPVAVAEQQQQAPEPIVVESEGVSDSPAAEDAAIENVVPEDGVSEGAVSEGAVSEDAIPAATPSRDQTDEQAESAPAESAPAESVPAESAAPATTAGSIGDSVLEAYNNLKGERRLLGVGILALTLIVALLMAWRLPMRRNVEDPQAWGIPQQQYYENYAPAEAPLEASPETARGPEGEPNGAASGAASGPPSEESQREPSVNSNGTSPAANGAEEDVLAEGNGAAASSPERERLRRIRHLRRISQRRSPSGWRGG